MSILWHVENVRPVSRMRRDGVADCGGDNTGRESVFFYDTD